VSGAQTPIPLHLEKNLFRIYFGSYDEQRRGNIYSLELDLDYPNQIRNLTTTPIVRMGEYGFYDDNGLIPSDLQIHNGKIYLYTIGFSQKNRILFDAAPGLASSHDMGKTFEKFTGPVIDRTIDDPCFATSPCVIHDEGVFKMWYVSGQKWEEDESGRYKHYYVIRSKTSLDGIYWDAKSHISIDFQNEYEYAIARPSVIRDLNGVYKMWYCFRAQPDVETYRIGYAESEDGLSWTRKDHLMKSFDVSAEGWDSEMICYPSVFDHDGKRYMFYNGNGYGRSGFGLAVLEQD